LDGFTDCLATDARIVTVTVLIKATIPRKMNAINPFIRSISFIIGISVFTCCSTKEQSQKEQKDTSYNLTNADSLVHRQINSYWQLRCGLFINNAGDIAFKATDNWYKLDTTGKSKPFDVYLTTVWNARPYDTLYEGRDELKNVVDTATLQILDVEHFKDKRHVYHFTAMADGGSLSLMDNADTKTFRVIRELLIRC
jgi:hypothetical protein